MRSVYVANFYYGNHLLEFTDYRTFKVGIIHLSKINDTVYFSNCASASGTHFHIIISARDMLYIAVTFITTAHSQGNQFS